MQFNPLSNNFLKYVGSSDKSPGKRPQQQLQQTSNRAKKQKEEPETLSVHLLITIDFN